MCDYCDCRANAIELIAVLGDHTLREESDLFPAAHQLLTPSAWAAIEAIHPIGEAA